MFSNFKKLFVAALFGIIFASQAVALSDTSLVCACQRPQNQKSAGQQ